MTKVISYQRVSSKGQDVHRQQTLAEEYCEMNGYELVKVIQEKISGAAEDRESIKTLMECTKEDADLVIVSELSRITREEDYDKIIYYIRTLKDNGLDIVFLDEPNTIYRHNERFTLTQLITLIVKAQGAAEERAKIKSRMQSGKRDKANQNPYMAIGSKITFGFYRYENPNYDKSKTTTECQTLIAINEKERTAVKMVYDMVIQGQSSHKIAEWLNANGYTNSRGHEFSWQNVLMMVKNRIYKGERELFGKVVKIEPIISAAQWEQANNTISAKRCQVTKKDNHFNPLKGLFYCSDCGCPMGIFEQNKQIYYRSYHMTYKKIKAHLTKNAECKASRVAAENLNNAVWNLCKEFVNTDEYYGASNMAFAELKQQESQLIGAFTEMVEKRNTIKYEIETYQAQADPNNPLITELINNKVEELIKNRREIESKMKDNQKAMGKLTVKMAELKQQLPTDEMTIYEKAEFYHRIIDRIEWNSELFAESGTIKVTYKNGTTAYAMVMTRYPRKKYTRK